MEGIYLVQHYGSTSTRGQNQLHSGFILNMQGGRLVAESFTDCTMLRARERARALLNRDAVGWDIVVDEEIPIFEARESVRDC